MACHFDYELLFWALPAVLTLAMLVSLFAGL